MSEPDPAHTATPSGTSREDASNASRPEDSSPSSGDAAATGTPMERFRELASRRTSGGDNEAETSLWTGTYSSKAMVGVWAGLSLFTLALVVAAIMVEAFSLWWALGIAVAAWLIGVVQYLWRRFSIHYELTTQRFIHKDGLVTRHTDRIEVIDISDVSYRQGPVERMLGVGTIIISSSDVSHPSLTMIGIDDVTRVATLIDDTRRKERRKRSLHLRQM